MKRVLHIVGGMNRAGAETMIMNIFRVIDKTLFQFDFLVFNNDKQDYEDEIVKLGGRVIHMSVREGVAGGLKSIYNIRKIIKDYGPYCAIHAATLHNSAFALLASAGIKNLKRIVHSHNTYNTLNPALFKRIYNSVTKWIIRCMSDECIACGQEAGEYLFGKELFNRKGIVLNNSIDVDRFYDASPDSVVKLKTEFDIKDDELVIGSIARICHVKNHRRMIETAFDLKKRGVPFKMIFVGRGDLEEELKDLAQKLDLEQNIIFAGVRSDIPVLMHTFDVFLMPSFFEGNPVTLIEAQASGLPAVISNVITEKIDLGLGLINRVSLEADNSCWVEKILSVRKATIPKDTIKHSLSANGYDLNSNANLLCNLYNK